MKIKQLGRLIMQFVTGSKASIFVRKTLSVRLRDQQCVCIAKLGGQDRRFSMKMMFAAGYGTPSQPVRTVSHCIEKMRIYHINTPSFVENSGLFPNHLTVAMF